MEGAENRREGRETLRVELLRPVVLVLDALSKGKVKKKGLFIWICRRAEEESRGSMKVSESLRLCGTWREKTSRWSDGRKRRSLRKQFFKWTLKR